MPHAPGLRRSWIIRAGLLLYDALARNQTLPHSRGLDLTRGPYSSGLQPQYTRGYAYSDCRVDDARLVIANARAAADLGARILPRTACVHLERTASGWRARLRQANEELTLTARAVINAAGPWASHFLARVAGEAPPQRLRLVQGSHIVVPRLYHGDHAFIVQNDDRRVIFVYGYEGAYTLVGTTELEMQVAVQGEIGRCSTSPGEIDYLCRAVNRYFTRQVTASDVVWSYCGVRALVDDGGRDPSSVTREYALELDAPPGQAPLLSVYGGKITTYRSLAERVMEKLAPSFPALGKSWTAHAALPGGEIERSLEAYEKELRMRYPQLPDELLGALCRRHGARTAAVLGSARDVSDLGEYYGGQLYSREIDYLIQHEWAREAEDVLWRRTKTGLHLSPVQQGKVRDYMARRTITL
jgi:glycerol-3-phosphate dehydrogenase